MKKLIPLLNRKYELGDLIFYDGVVYMFLATMKTTRTIINCYVLNLEDYVVIKWTPHYDGDDVKLIKSFKDCL